MLVISNHQQIAQLTHADWNTPICSWSSSPAALSSWRTWLASWCCTQVHPPEPADLPWIRAYQRVECKALENHEFDNAHMVFNMRMRVRHCQGQSLALCQW